MHFLSCLPITVLFQDPDRELVLQRRYSFLYGGKTFSIHKYLAPRSDLTILHCQDSQRRQEKNCVGKTSYVDLFPPFLRIGEPLDEDGKLSAYQLSLKKTSGFLATPCERIVSMLPPRAKSFAGTAGPF